MKKSRAAFSPPAVNQQNLNCQPWIGLELFPYRKMVPISHYCHVRMVITPYSPAENGGIKVGDKIVKLDYENVLSLLDLYNISLLKNGRSLIADIIENTGLRGRVTIVQFLKGQARVPFI